MGRVKVKKKDVFIDMTAMSDVTVLLLTFFMLTSTFLQKEPVIVNTPSSVAEVKVPDSNLVTVLVSPKGKVFLSLTGSKDSTYSSEKMRLSLLESVTAEYNKHYKTPVSFTDQQKVTFARSTVIGLPISKLGEYLDLLGQNKVEKADELTDPEKNPNAGIPIDMNEDLNNPNEFQIWMNALYDLPGDAAFYDDIISGKAIALKADKSTPYDVVQVVMDNLQTLKMNKFTFMTALKTEK
jgi:biopolymer transport protein ExbD